MNSDQIVIAEYRSDTATKSASQTDLFIEMQNLGIDPNPLLEIAAHDLLNQYGADALSYSIQIERNFYEEGDRQSASIWQKIITYLECLNGPGELVAH